MPLIIGPSSRRRLVSAGDPLWAYVTLLIQPTGPDASTTITDLSTVGATITAAGNFQQDTGDIPTGAVATCLCDGTGDYGSLNNHAGLNFDSGDFCIELWLKHASWTGTGYNALSHITDGSNWFYMLFEQTGGTGMEFTVRSGGSTIIQAKHNATTGYSGWMHFAIIRNGSNFYLTRDGITIASTTYASAWPSFTGVMRLGGANSGGGGGADWSGGISPIRITKGNARYAPPFTPDTLPWPTS